MLGCVNPPTKDPVHVLGDGIVGRRRELEWLRSTGIDVRGRISCWTERPICQSLGRTPQPLSNDGSSVAVAFGLPKF